MATPLTGREFDELVSNGILEEVFFAGYDRAMEQGMSVLPLFGQTPITSRTIETLGLGGLGKFEQRKEGDSPNVDNMEQLFKTTFTAVEYNKVVPIDYTLVEDQQYLQINDIIEALGDAAAKTRRDHAASVFYNAFSSSYLGGDSKALCATDHPLDKNGDNEGGNKGTTALSYDAAVSTIKEMMLFKDARNKPISIVPDTLVIPVALWETGIQITENINEPETADRNINAIQSRGGLRMIVDPFLDAEDSNDWYLVDSVTARRHLKWINRETVSFGVDMPSQTDKNYYVGGSMRYDYGWSDWRWCFGHEVA
jgi:phage major head subunit gpT-like protein